MMATLVSEWRKVFTTRMWWILMLCMAGYCLLMSLGMAAIFHFMPAEAAGLPDDSGLAQVAYSMGTFVAMVFPLLAGAMTVTQEFRHQTLTPTLLVNPHRATVLAAKGLVGAVLGVLFGAAALMATMGPTAGLLEAVGGDSGLGMGSTWAWAGRSLGSFALWAVIGVGLGALVANQVAVIVVILAITQFVEPLLRMIPALVGHDVLAVQLLPSAGADSVTGMSYITAMAGGEAAGTGLLAPWAGILVMLAWGLVPGVIGYFTTLRRDIT
jgi:ABC-type transport system involved in multi-copper enzyme maturation permease subunit